MITCATHLAQVWAHGAHGRKLEADIVAVSAVLACFQCEAEGVFEEEAGALWADLH